MPDMIDRLLLDHERLHNVLKELARAASDANSGETSAEDRLVCMVDYLLEYPHRIHHPTEDLVFRRVLGKNLTTAQSEVITQNAAQHRQLEEESESLFAAVDAASLDLEDVAARIERFCARQSQHMAHEESVVFPLAAELLDEHDWEALEAEYRTLHDPLFDAAESRFEALYECLGVDPDAVRSSLGASAMAKFLNAT